jgi:Uma2 family endonuclease
MSIVLSAVTAEELAAMPDKGERLELVEGELRMVSPAGNLHGRVAMRLAWRLAQHVEQHQLGAVYAAETGFLLNRDPDTVRAPDVAFVRQELIDQTEEIKGYLPLAPDLVAEVVSPGDTYTQVEEKALAWLDAGTRLVLVVDPGTRTVRIYRSKDDIRLLREPDELEANDVVKGWKLPVADMSP